MAIPKHDEIRVPALQLLLNGETLQMKDFERSLAKHFHLSDDEVTREYDSGNGRIFYDRIAWALSYMNIVGLLKKPKRGYFHISELGRKQLEHPEHLNEYIAEQMVKRNSNKRRVNVEQENEASLTPQEELYQSSQKIRDAIYEEILDTILSKDPKEFENLVVMLLQRMGYGGEIEDSAEVTKYTNDRGIDGIIKEDVLGLGRIHIQAKRYAKNNSVGRQEIQKFVGALAVAKSNKGVFITTSGYSKGAIEYVDSLAGSATVVLVDGRKLAEYIYDYNLGMQIEQTIDIKKLDSDFWDGMRDEKSNVE